MTTVFSVLNFYHRRASEWDILEKRYTILSGPIDEKTLPKITEDPNKIYRFEKWDETGSACASIPVHYKK